jgi:hypothetical protein
LNWKTKKTKKKKKVDNVRVETALFNGFLEIKAKATKGEEISVKNETTCE